MSPDSAVTIAVVGVLATCVGGLLWIIKFLFNSFVPLLNQAIANIKDNSRITKSADTYLRERNGRDSEIHEKLIKEIQTMPDRITQTIKEQHVAAQVVEKSIIKEKK